MFEKIIEPLASSLQSPFIPSSIKKKADEFWKVFMSNAGFSWMLKGSESTYNTEYMNREIIFEVHKSLYEQILEWLKYEESNFLFSLSKTNNG